MSQGDLIMRDYSKISPKFWVGNTGRQIRKLGVETQLVAMYLLTNPHCNMIGIYYLPIVYISHETGIPIEGASKALQSLCDIQFCQYDDHSEYVWVHEMAFFQIGAELDPKDKRVKGINEAYAALPNLPFIKDFYEKYCEAFHLEICRENAKKFNPIEGASKPLASQEQEQEQEQKQEQEQEQEQGSATSLRSAAPVENFVLTIPLKNNFDFPIHTSMIDEWQQLYPAIDVLQTLRNICGWNQGNPQKRKTERGILKHIHGWLAKEQEKQSQHFHYSKPISKNVLFDHNKAVAQQWVTTLSQNNQQNFKEKTSHEQ